MAKRINRKSFEVGDELYWKSQRKSIIGGVN
jgi:hypothetical protein